MLTALNSKNEVVNTLKITRTHLRQLSKSQTPFYCPYCKSPLLLKVGYQKIPHFAHVSTKTCSITNQSESVQHIQSKKLLYEHLITKYDQVQLEHHIPNIGQIADIFVKTDKDSFAIELQCSSISISDLKSRTNGYISSGILPLWILVQKINDKHLLSLTNFQQSFIRYSPKLGYFLLQFSPEESQFNVYTNLVPISITKFIGNKAILPLNEFSFPLAFLQRNKDINISPNDWRKYRNKWITTKISFSGRERSKSAFLKEVYNEGDIFQYLPGFIGLPIPHMILIKNHPIEWQYYIWKDLLKRNYPGNVFTLTEVVAVLKKRVRKNDFVLRDFPILLDHKYDLTYIAQQYLFLLEKLDILVEVETNVFRLIQHWPNFQTFSEMEYFNKELFSKWEHILNKVKLQEKSF